MNIKEAVEQNEIIISGLNDLVQYKLTQDAQKGIIGFRKGHPLAKALNKLSSCDGLFTAVLRHLFNEHKFKEMFNPLMESAIFDLLRKNKQLELQNEALRIRLNKNR